MNILITGSEGFVGSHIVDELCQNADNLIYGIDNLSKHNKERGIKYKNYTLFKVDILSNYYKELIHQLQPNIIIDLASLVGGINLLNRNCVISDMIYNIDLFNQTFQCAKSLHSLKHFISFSTSIVYEKIKTFPTPELKIEDIPIPNSPYGYYKYTCEYMLQNSNLPWTIIRPYNCIGVGDDHEHYAHVFTDFIRQAKRDKKIKVCGGNQIRSFIDCRDVARAISYIIESNVKTIHKTYNVGNPNNNCYISSLAYTIGELLNLDISKDISIIPNYNMLDVGQMEPNIDKIKSELLFFPKYTLNESLMECIKYYE